MKRRSPLAMPAVVLVPNPVVALRLRRIMLGAAVASLLGIAPVTAATITFDGGVSGTGTALDTAANWVGDTLPSTTSEVLLDNSVITLPTMLTTTGASPTYGDLIWNNNTTSAITINTGTATSRTITLSGGGGSTAAIAAGGASGDLLLMGSAATTNTLTVGGNIGAGTGRLNLVLGASGNFNVVNAGATLNVTGIISETGGARALTKTGAGTVILSAANTYTGATTINAGTLQVNADGAISASSLVTVNSGGTLRVTSVRGINTGGTLTVNDGGTVFINNNATNVRLDLNTVNMTGGSITGAANANVFSGLAGTTGSGLTFNINANATPSTIDTVRLQANPSASGSGLMTFNVANGGQANVSSVIYNGAQGVVTALTKSGAGTLTLTGDSTYTGNTTVSAGTLKVSAGGTIYANAYQPTAVLTVQSGGIVELNNWSYDDTVANSQSLGGLRANSDAIAVNGGTIRITGVAPTSYVRGFTLGSSGATLDAAAGANWTLGFNASSPIVNSANGALTLTGAGTGVLDKVLPGSAAVTLTKTGAGDWTLTRANTYTGNTTVSAGTLKVAAGGAIYANAYQPSAVLTVQSGGILELNNWSYDDTVANSQSLGGLRANSNAIVVNGGTIRITGATPTSYTRGFTLGANGATLEAAAGANWTLGFNASTPIINSANGDLTLTGAGTGVLSKVLSGSAAVSLTKSGFGSWTLTAANTYAGGTQISGGTLFVNNSSGSATGTGAVSLLANATLAGSGSVSGLVTTAATSSTFSPGNSPGTLSLLGGLNAAAGATFNFELGTVSDQINLGSSLFTGSTNANGLRFNFSDAGGLATGVTYTLLSFGSSSNLNYSDLLILSKPGGVTLDASFGVGGWQINGNNLQVQFMVVPEPSTSLLLALGLVGIGCAARRRSVKSRSGSA